MVLPQIENLQNSIFEHFEKCMEKNKNEMNSLKKNCDNKIDLEVF